MIAPSALPEPLDPTPLLREYAEWTRRNAERLPLVARGNSRTLLYRTPSFEIIAMRWAPGAATPIHDHGESRCATLLVEGALAVEHFARTDFSRAGVATVVARGAVRMARGDMESLHDASELHRVRTIGAEAALAVHLYALPLRRYNVFREDDGRIDSCLAAYDLVLAPS
jgi:predicted metal-dependent enzyme (double-stranded beta helix superfamily)